MRYLIAAALIVLSSCTPGRYVTVWTAPQVMTGRSFVICTVNNAGTVQHCL